jgi:hypothetical protein
MPCFFEALPGMVGANENLKVCSDGVGSLRKWFTLPVICDLESTSCLLLQIPGQMVHEASDFWVDCIRGFLKRWFLKWGIPNSPWVSILIHGLPTWKIWGYPHFKRPG